MCLLSDFPLAEELFLDSWSVALFSWLSFFRSKLDSSEPVAVLLPFELAEGALSLRITKLCLS